jgi:hypothetical protein
LAIPIKPYNNLRDVGGSILEKTRKNVFLGERGPLPPFLVNDFIQSARRGQESLSPLPNMQM